MVDNNVVNLGLAGSLRRGSYNRALLRAAAQLAPAGVTVRPFDALGALPFYDGDVEAAGTPAGVDDLRRAVAQADALLIATPEYNDGTSAVLKNALDWASRGPVRLLAGKPVAVMGISPGRNGARGGIEAVVRTVRRTGSDVLDRALAVPFAQQVFDEELVLTDPAVRAEVGSLVAELAERARSAVDLAA
jgi:chromate reductase